MSERAEAVPSVPEQLQGYDLEAAMEHVHLLLSEPEMELSSAFKAAANDIGIPWGEPMAAFVHYANQRLGIA